MRHAFFTLMIFLLLVFAGCSSSANNPTQPAGSELPQTDASFDGIALCYQGTFEIDLETQTITQIENRQSDYVYDITGFLPDKCPGGCFRFTIVGVVGTVLEIELTLENPLTIQVYDARVQYLDLFGKTVLNPDSYTDFLGTPITEVYPFTAFVKENPDRAFPIGPGGIDTETMFLNFPTGASPAVSYAVTTHLPGQTLEPYEISEMAQDGELTPTGGSAIISCKVDDHQDDISGVYMDATPFTGGPVALIFNDPLYEVAISNSAGASEGIYNQLIMALSPNPQEISTYNYVEITVSSGTSQCPDAPYAGNTFDGNFSFDDMCSHSATNWTSDSDQIIDSDMLSDGNGVAIYSDIGNYNGELRMFEPDTNIFTAVGPDYPGSIGVSIDVDSTDLVVFVTSTLPQVVGGAEDIPLATRIAASNDYFTVVDPFTGPSTEQIVNVGTPIEAIDIDAYDDIWVLDTYNIMHRYVKSNGYTEDLARQFDLDVTTSGVFAGLVFDFVINFHNEAFFILTNETGRGVVWRIECDGSYSSDINGNPNPKMDILPNATTNDVADIGIDNLNISGNVLDGAQDSQIFVVGGFAASWWEWDSMITRIDSELNQYLTTQNADADGLTNAFFDQRLNVLWGWQSDLWSDSWTENWNAPGDWE